MQAEPITTIPKNFTVYKSSAGAGKTFTLVKEYLCLCVTNPREDYYRSILAITFTNKAAGEMRERVLSVLNAWCNNTTSNTSAFIMLNLISKQLNLTNESIQVRAARVYTHMLHHYSDISIKTIDKFTTQVIRTFASDLGMPAHFQLTVDTHEPLQYAVQELLSKAGEDSVLSDVILKYVMYQLDNDKDYKLHEALYNAGKLVFDEKHFDKLKTTQHVTLTDYLTQQQALKKEVTTIATNTQNIAKQLITLMALQGLTVADFTSGSKGPMGQVAKLLTERYTIASYEFLDKAGVKKAISDNAWYAKTNAKQVGASIDSIAPQLNSLMTELYAVMTENKSVFILTQLVLDNFYAFILLTEIDKLVQQYKEENNTALLAEFNATIAQVVAQEPAPFIYERLGERYNHFLIDEFQDTSTMQFINLLPLLDNSLAQGHSNLLVGDAKQSIYRFRGGEASLISNLPHITMDENNVLFTEYKNTLQRNFTNSVLNSNFRSKREVIEFNNYFFEESKQLLNPLVASYYEEHTQLFKEDNTGGYVSVQLIEYDRVEQYDAFACEYVLHQINNCIADGYSLGDIAILVRGNKDGATIAEFLTENNINVLSDDALWLGKNTTVKFVLNVCALITDLQNYTAAHSVINYLYHNQHTTQDQYLQSMQSLRSKQAIAAVINVTHPQLNFKTLQALSLYDAVQYIVMQFKLMERAPNYVLSFLNNVWARTIDGQDSWAEYIEYWNAKGYKQSINQANTGNAVRVLTIHKSKGLEFDVVIIPKINADYKFKRNEVIDASSLNIDVPMGLVTINKKLEPTVLNNLYISEAISLQADELNTLYVAFTRAVHRLYVLSGSKIKNKEVALELDDDKCATINAIVTKVIKNSTCYDAATQCYTHGTLQPFVQKHNALPTEKLDVSMNEKIWFNELSIGKKHTLINTAVTELDQKNYGIVLHTILAQMKDITDVPKLLAQLQLNGELTANVAETLQQDITHLWQSNAVDEWKNNPITITNEQNLLTHLGEVLRPDKVIECTHEVWVYDFKTGETNTSHSQQIITYTDALRHLYNKPIRGKLIYLQKGEVNGVLVL
ncbi:MAG: UvrD-helicase domain-containing protein [Bacteroidia bacterium]|nr:UvrD-helicase domain-containing protein [Bacteroidia bacterium]